MDIHVLPERKFGYVFAFAFAGLGSYGLIAHWPGPLVLGWFSAAMAFALLATLAPRLLAPLNRGWLGLGHILGRIVSPVVLGIMYFGLLTPVAVVGRIFGRDELKLRRRSVGSYWIERSPPGPASDSLGNQF